MFHFMKNALHYYSVGPLLYCPGNRKTIAPSIIQQKLGDSFSLALCLEDTINDSCVEEAEHCLAASVSQIQAAAGCSSFYMPDIFIRVRSPRQILKLPAMLGTSAGMISGFIIPKFSLENADNYIQMMIKANELSSKTYYMMPIFESTGMIDLRSRYDVLYTLKEKLKKIEPIVLNIRVGGNDLCHLYGFRRHADESIHKIRPVSDLFSDIVTVYGMDYVISGPVWEYYSGPDWKRGLLQEISDDRLCGFIGKTVIHPNQIDVVNQAYRVPQKDYDDARRILNWDTASASYVSADIDRERMDEYKTHGNWAQRVLWLAEAFGVS